MSSFWVRLGRSLPATEVAHHGAPTWETQADGGVTEITFDFALPAAASHPMLTPGTLVEVIYGAQPVATGRITDYDRNTGEVVASGLAEHAARLAALTDTGGPTLDLGWAINVARSWGWAAENPRGVNGIVTGEEGAPIYLGELFSRRASETGARWGVDGEGDIYMRPDPTEPTYILNPGAAAFGVTSEDVTSHLVGSFVNIATGSLSSLVWPTSGTPHAHEIVDLTNRGPVSITEVGVILGGMLVADVPAAGWTGGVEVRAHQITRHGVPAELALVSAGQMVRATGFAVDSVDAPWLDVVIGKTRYTAGSDVIQLEPVNKAPRTYTDVMAAS